MACARLAKPTGVFCFRSHPVKVARVGSSMAIPIAECRPCICFSPGMCCPDDRAHWRAHCQFFYPFSMGTCTKYKGAMRSQWVGAPEVAAPLTVAALAQHLPSPGWYRRRVSEGSKGPIEYEFARKRVTLCKDDLPERTVWLVIKRTLGAHPTDAFYISNAPESAPLRLFVWLSGIRWAVEQSFEETKTELVMAHYEVRKYPGWHRHMLTS